MTGLPEFLQKSASRKLEKFCRLAAQDAVNPRTLAFRIAGRQIYLFEIRETTNKKGPAKELPMARIRFCPELNQWSLHHQNGSHWQLYLNTGPTLELDKLLAVIRQDPFGFFRTD